MCETNPTTTQRARIIRASIRSEERRLIQKYPVLAHRDLLGTCCVLGCLIMMAFTIDSYLRGHIAWWLAIPLMAFPLSILHEIEHDLIHDLYFKRLPWIQNLLFTVIWIAKLSINPWYRRGIHMKHHVVSGQPNDIEERLIGLGLPFGLLRVLVTIHPLAGLLLFRRIKAEIPSFDPLRLVLLSFPTYTLFNFIWESYFGYLRLQTGWTFAYDPAQLLPAWGWPWARDLTVLFVAPNVLRQSCLVMMSSYSHYYGDIPEHDVFYQNQILSGWMFAPLQLFCFNFGATHIIHHYVMNQPCYLRQLVSHAVLAEMRRQGTRVNDLGTFTRANRWGSVQQELSTRPSELATTALD